MRNIVGRVFFVAVAALLGGCVTQAGVNPAAPPTFVAGTSRVVLMPIDVQLFELTASGLEEPRADWTQAAQAHVQAALREENEKRRLRLADFDAAGISETAQPDIRQIVKLHQAVGEAMLLHNHVPALRLPTKTSVYDWSIGREVALIKDQTGADYALFVYLKDSYSSADRVAVNVLMAVMLGATAGGGTQIGYASLIDLNTGQVTWFSSLLRGTGDLRTPEAAAGAVGELLQTLPGA
jgi:hypothetical protein